MPKKREIEFEPEVQEFLNMKSKSTAKSYSGGFVKFLKYYQSKYGKDKNIGDFLDRIFEEFKKPRREQQNIAEIEIKQYIDYLKDKKLKNGKGLSNNTIRVYFAAIQDFLKWKQVTVSMRYINVPPPVSKKSNGKHEWTIDQVKEFVDAAENYRDKAIIMCIFQSGLGINEICELNYGDIKKEFEAEILPICLHLVRQKTNVEFKTFFGRDAVKYLRLYLATRPNPKPDDPLFVKERAKGGEERITPILIETQFGHYANKVDFVEVEKGHYNPARPHSLRAAFNSRLMNKIDKDLREFFMGHSVGGVSRAYLAIPTEELRKLYMGVEEFLKIEMTSQEEKDQTAKSKDMATMMLEGKVNELEQRVKMHEEIFKQMTAMSFEEFAKWMQDKNRWEWHQQREEDKRQFSDS